METSPRSDTAPTDCSAPSEMLEVQQSRVEYELSKYLHLFQRGTSLPHGDTALKGPLNDRIELTIVRLAVQGAFLVLNDGNRLHFVAGGRRVDPDDTLSRVEFESKDGAWLHFKEPDRSTWLSLFQEINAIDTTKSGPASERALSISALQHDPRTSRLSLVSNPPRPCFFAGVPLTSKNGHNIGAICVVNGTERPPLSVSEAEILADTAQRCTNLLELARERSIYSRWTSVQEEVDTFLNSRSLHAQLLEEPQTPAGRKSTPQKIEADKRDGHGGERVDPDTLAEDSLSGLGDPPVEGKESERLVDAEAERDRRIAEKDNAQNARSLTAKRGKDDERGLPKGETTYRKVFRRAAQCLRTALQADGVLFVDGLIGFHGDAQPAAEPEQELEREIARPTGSEGTPAQENAVSTTDQNGVEEDQFDPHGPDPPGTHSRVYTSAEFLRGVYGSRPSEILGLSGSDHVLKRSRISESTIGLSEIDEGFLQRLMDRHPKGVVWYRSQSRLMEVQDGTLVEIDLAEEAQRLMTTFEQVSQLMFKPLTDPSSLKRLGGCFAWRTASLPLFTDAVDLGSLKAFLHIVESEFARFDAASAAKQKETFVSSVSHELRTPLHGILGAVQLLDESGLDPMQKSLAGMITTCGSTLHETLTSVLSYAKINQFERRQHQYRHRRPPDAVWALTNKQGLASGPDRDYEGLYICTNLALLTEEILGVLEAGKSFQSSHSGKVIVVCNIKYEENWSYLTEPGALRRIAVNLIGNALKYTRSGSVVVTLDAEKVVEDNKKVSNDLTTGRTLIFNVQDTGKGMSRDFMDNQLFLPFTQEDSTSSHGVGLGMSIVKSLISLLSGEIQVRSEESKGTEIIVKIPMRQCSSGGHEEKGQAALDFERHVQDIRNRKLSAVMYGFPQFVRESLTNYLCEWFHCELLEPTDDIRPDIVLVDEGNEEVLEAVKSTAHAYGKTGVLLSIVMVPSRLGKRMDTIDGYIKWERIPRPLGPSNVAQGLLSCLLKLDQLRKFGDNASIDTAEEKEPQGHKSQDDQTEDQEAKNSTGEEQYMPSLEKLQISENAQSPFSVRVQDCCEERTSKAASESSESATKKEQQVVATERAPDGSSDEKSHSKPASKVMRILIVDDNVLNLRLLGAFFKKNGYRDTQQAKHGREAVEAAQSCAEGFDIIFMDLSMPIMDGFEATRQIRRMEAGHERAFTAKPSVIIALTGLASANDENDAFDAGVDLYLTKPVQFPKLSSLLSQYKEGTLKKRRRSETSN